MSRRIGRWWWTASETADPAIIDGINRKIEEFMLENNVRYAQVAIGMGGAKYQGIYTYSEFPWKHVIQHSDKFMLASVSKAFVCAAIYKLYPTQDSRLNTLAYEVLGYATSSPKDQRMNSINLQMLVDHTAGFDDGVNGPPPESSNTSPDWSSDARSIAAAIGEDITTTQQIVDYVWTKTNLNYTPFDDPNHGDFRYSNVGYLILSHVVAKKTGMPYHQYLQQAVLDPLSLKSLTVPTLQKDYPASGLIIPEASGTGLPAYDYKDTTTQVSQIYGGDDMIKETCNGNCTLALNARDVVNFIGNYAVWGIGDRATDYTRTGSWYGSSTMANSTDTTTSGKGFDVAVLLNTRDFTSDSNLNIQQVLYEPIIQFLKDTWKGY